MINFKKMKVKELKEFCKEKKVKGYSKMKRKELVDMLETKYNKNSGSVNNGPSKMRPMSPLLNRINQLI